MNLQHMSKGDAIKCTAIIDRDPLDNQSRHSLNLRGKLQGKSIKMDGLIIDCATGAMTKMRLSGDIVSTGLF